MDVPQAIFAIAILGVSVVAVILFILLGKAMFMTI